MKQYLPFILSQLGIAIMILAMVVGPFFSPLEYFWLQHSMSEQAGQHMGGVWIMLVSFVGLALEHYSQL